MATSTTSYNRLSKKRRNKRNEIKLKLKIRRFSPHSLEPYEDFTRLLTTDYQRNVELGR
jgi:hypothetical protein